MALDSDQIVRKASPGVVIMAYSAERLSPPSTT
jgi:hypothetical protein